MSDDTILNGGATQASTPPESDIEVLRKHLQPKYKIEKKLGSGGMADVYLGYHNQLKRKVAVKVLPRVFARDEAMVQRFLQEAESAAQLDHPNIIGIYDIGVAGPLNYFIMAFVPGGTLKDRLKKKKKLGVENASRIITQICRALHYAHVKGVVHRDIKPDNIMFDEHENAILTDFGIAKAKFASRMTATGTLIGTPHYMSPEQLRGKEVDGRSDIYSLGILFYEILTGKVPFEGEDTYSVGLKHIQEPPVPPLELNHDIPVPLNNVILTMLAKVPDARFHTAEEVADSIDAILEGRDAGLAEAEKVSEQAQAAVQTWRMQQDDVQEGFQQLQQTMGNVATEQTVLSPTAAQVHTARTEVRDFEKPRKASKAPLIISLALAAAVIIAVAVTVVIPMLGDQSQTYSRRDRGDRGRDNGDNGHQTLAGTTARWLFRDYGLMVLCRSSSGFDVKLLTDEDGSMEPVLDQYSNAGVMARDMAYSPIAERFIIEQTDGSLITANSTGFDVLPVEIAEDAGASGPKMASWSPDGKKIVYSTIEAGRFHLKVSEISEIGTVEATFDIMTSDKTIISPVFIPGDESIILFGEYDDGPRESRLRLFEPGDDDPEIIFTIEGQVQHIAMSPDGEAVACLVDQSGDDSAILVFNEDEGEINYLVRESGIVPRIVFSPDAEYVIFAVRDASNDFVHLKAQPVNGEDSILLTEDGIEMGAAPLGWIDISR